MWGALGAGDQDAPGRVLVGDDGAWLGGPLAVDDLALGAVATALLAAADLGAARSGGPAAAVAVSGEHVALSFHSERNTLLAGRAAGAMFAPLSRFVRCSGGGWARTHANYPHHAAALRRALSLDPAAEADAAVSELERAAAATTAEALEDAVVAEGGCAAALRAWEQWEAHPAGAAVAAQPLIRANPDAAAVVRLAPGRHPGAARPAAGIRVLDLTRVIAGPVAGRTLAALGADVLRVDPPQMPELPAQHLDANPGKRSSLLDLRDEDTREALLAGADVILSGYRPGALAPYGLEPSALAERHPGLVQVSLSAWGLEGPWRERRGFDSLVQVASGIAGECAAGAGAPGALPAQALDHASGHLMAAAALVGLARRVRGERAPAASLSLARTAAELLRLPRPGREHDACTGQADPERHRVAFGDVSMVAPPGTLDGEPLRWAHGPRPYGSDAAHW
jgi:crotonobetainyl-CoA:carnitine CoA-transferase CaiB-like acyl-CoA transferase